MGNIVDFVGKATPLADIDIPQIGSLIGVGEDELHAFMDVEASGKAFDEKGRPKMLGEGAQLYRNLSGEERDTAVSRGLAWPSWDPKGHLYPKDSYPWLKEAMKINQSAAIASASWGLTQILASNCKDAGYDSPIAMCLAFQDSERAHLEATVKCLIAWKIDDDLRAHRWEVVARVWNGPKYAVNKYDTKLAARYNWWAKIPDTPWDGPMTTPVAIVSSIVRRNSKGDDVKTLQTLLNKFGYNLVVDGDFGSTTEGAVKKFQGLNSLVMDGIVGKKTWDALSRNIA